MRAKCADAGVCVAGRVAVTDGWVKDFLQEATELTEPTDGNHGERAPREACGHKH